MHITRVFPIFFLSILLQLCLSFVSAFAESAPRKALPMPHFSESAQKICANRAVYLAYQDSVFDRTDEQLWVSLMFRRASACQQMYPENNALIDEISDYFKQPARRIPDAAYDSLFSVLEDIAPYNDVFLLEYYTQLLLPHYEARKDTTRLLMLNHYAGYCYTDICRSYEPELVHRAADYFKRNLEFGRHFASLDAEAAQVIPRDYINMCYMLTSLGGVSPEQALVYLDDFAHFLKANEAHIPQESFATYQEYLEYIRITLFRMFATSRVKTSWSAADTLALHKLFDLSPFAGGSMEHLNTADDSLCYYHAMASLGKMPVREAYQECDQLLMKVFDRFSRLDDIQERDMLDIFNGMVATFKLMEQSDESEYFMTQRVSSFTYRFIDMIQRIRIVGNYLFFDYVLSSLASEEVVLNHLPSAMKEQFISKIAVKSQVGTAIHVNMVERLSVAFFEHLIDKQPQLFVGLMGCQSVADLRAHRSELMQYVSMAALFHDLGKTQMAEIVGNNFRHLTDHEYQIIKMHPEKSSLYFRLDPILEKYEDVALGHHKWYDGKGGYPASFDNTLSPWRPVIDLITLCDCIDAATDYLDRNYRVPKTLDQIVEEFKTDAGTRYNPQMVQALCDDAGLRKHLNNIIISDRPRQASLVRARYIHVKDEN